jgi:hypothetical protein
MIRPQVSNAVLVSILFSVLAGGGMLLVTGAPAVRHAAAAVERCDLSVETLLGKFWGPPPGR